MEMVTLTIDNKSASAKRLHRPASGKGSQDRNSTLCFLKDINEIGACRMCLVEIKGAKSWKQLVFTCLRGWKYILKPLKYGKPEK